MLTLDNVTVSFRLNLNREEDCEIQRCLINEQMMKSFGGKSKFIKMALIMRLWMLFEQIWLWQI